MGVQSIVNGASTYTSIHTDLLKGFERGLGIPSSLITCQAHCPNPMRKTTREMFVLKWDIMQILLQLLVPYPKYRKLFLRGVFFISILIVVRWNALSNSRLKTTSQNKNVYLTCTFIQCIYSMSYASCADKLHPLPIVVQC